MKTKDRILDTALALFNQQGTNDVSTNHIAEALSMSPGNLYYHFRSKEEIIRALFERLFDAWDKEFVLPTDRPITLDDLTGLVRTNFDILWRYRFTHRELIALLRQDETLRQRYLVVRERGYTGFRETFAYMKHLGLLIDVDADTITKLADLCWLIGEFWLSSLEVSGNDITPEQLERGIDLMIQVLNRFIEFIA